MNFPLSAITGAPTCHGIPPVLSGHALSPSFDGESTRAVTSTARLMQSVAGEAGLGRFVYLRGQSGRRYVFSPISRRQAALYDKALFAVGRHGSPMVQLSASASGARDEFDDLYVHLFGDDVDCVESVLADLNGGD